MSVYIKTIKGLIFLSILLVSAVSYAFLDFIGAEAKKTVEVAAYADAALDLATELTPDEDIKEGLTEISKRSDKLKSKSRDLGYLSSSVHELLKGPNWTSKRLDTNIRATSNYVKRFKRIVAKAAVLGNAGATSLNTAETNVALNEVQKNQQAMILQNEDKRIREIEKEQEEFDQWNSFSKGQRLLRLKEANGGKRY